MSESSRAAIETEPTNQPGQPGTATMPRPRRAAPRAGRMPQWKVLLHNDDVSTMDHVVATIVMVARIPLRQAFIQMIEAHTKGVALLLTTHREHAELLVEQFASRKLTITIEPDR